MTKVMNNRYIAAFNRMSRSLNPIAEMYGKSKAFFLLDAMGTYIRYGMTPNEYIGWEIYKKSTLERKRYFTYRDQGRYESKFNDPDCADTFNRKEKTNHVFSKFVRRDWLFGGESTEDEIRKFIELHPKCIVKPIGLSSGRGIFTLSKERGEDFDVLKSRLAGSQGGKVLLFSDILIEDFVLQHPDMAKLNPDSVNTVRIFTVADRQGNLKILSCGVRVGGKNADVDNYHAGGIGYTINPSSGVICLAGHDISGKEFYYHPSTGVQMIGYQIPNWSAVLDAVSELVKVEPRGRLIGWDLAIVEDGIELIEANYCPDPGFMQRLSEKGLKPEILDYM